MFTIEERDQLIAGTLRTQGQRNCIEALDGIETERDIVVTELIYQDGDGVELFVFGIHVGSGGACVGEYVWGGEGGRNSREEKKKKRAREKRA